MHSTRSRSAFFYGACLLILLILASKLLTHLLPGSLAHELDDESEALPIAILFCAYVQFLRVPWDSRRRDLLLVSGLLAVTAWVVAWLLLTLSLPSSVVTLNESFVAVGAMFAIACLPRPAPWAPLLSVVLLIVVVAFESTDFITTQAESVVPIVLSPIAFYWADRTILQPEAPSHPGRRLIWCVLLVIIPVVARAHVSIGSHHDVLRFERRATEGFLGLLLVHVFFSYWLGDRWAVTTPKRLKTSRGDAAAVSGRLGSTPS